ncbi:hypothetical protein QYF36_008066 [Acer negundo]|nr:hypothetical protein QYF36_008066 [Acer negundo]
MLIHRSPLATTLNLCLRLRFFSQSAAAVIQEDPLAPLSYDGFTRPDPKYAETILAIPRTSSGTKISKLERKVGRVPSIVFEQDDGQHGGNKLLISVQTNQIRKLVNHLGRSFFLSRLFDLEVRPEFGSGDVIEKVRVLPRLLHLHSGTDAPLNVTFLRAPSHALLKVNVPLVFRGEDVSPGLRKGSYLNTIKRTVKFICPADIIPPYIDVDLSELDVGQKIVMGDLKVHPALKLVQSKDEPVSAAMVVKSFQAIFLLSLLTFGVLSYSFPLLTRGKWIVDSTSGRPVKLACTSWASHLQPMLAEGLDKQPLRNIVAKVVQQHFSCVRLTWATYMFTRFNQSTVTQTLDSLYLTQAKEGIARNNPALLKMTVVQAYDEVVDELGRQGLMVVLDNHVSNPKWCCGNNDGNGFFGDTDFSPQEWKQGLVSIAQRFKSKNQVVAMSLRNELRGPRQNQPDWYKYISQGAKMVHQENPNVLVLVSGLSYGTDLSFLKNQTLGFNLDNKLVYESHWYSWTINSHGWEGQPLNKACAQTIQTVIDHSGFVTDGDNPIPLFLGEFGIDQRGTNNADNRFINCFFAYAAQNGFSWSLWALQGSYYLREGKLQLEEVFGVLNANWDTIRNPKFIKRLQVLQRFGQDPSSNLPTSYIMFHPDSGSCVRFSSQSNGIYADSSCDPTPIRWIHDQDGAPLRLTNTNLCLKVVGDGLAPKVSTDCSSQQSLWYSVSESKLQLAAKDANGQYLCLELDKTSSNSSQILTKNCICINDDSSCLYDPQSQWFTLAPKKHTLI